MSWPLRREIIFISWCPRVYLTSQRQLFMEVLSGESQSRASNKQQGDRTFWCLKQVLLWRGAWRFYCGNLWFVLYTGRCLHIWEGHTIPMVFIKLQACHPWLDVKFHSGHIHTCAGNCCDFYVNSVVPLDKLRVK